MTDPPTTITVTALEKQLQFIQSPIRETLGSGGYGSGKSMALALRCAMRATVPGARELLVRKWFSTLGRSTLSTLLQGDGHNPPALPPGCYTHNKTEHTIKIHGGGEIRYLGCDERQKLGSINSTGCGIDELAELTYQDYVMCRSRCRSVVDGLQSAVYAVTNPSGPLHWAAKHWGLDGATTPAKGTDTITMRTPDNVYLPREYVDELSRLVGADRARCFEGRWVQAEGLVYPDFDHNVMIRSHTGEWSRVVCGVDCGVNDPDVLLPVARDEAGRVHILDEFCKSHQSIDGTIDQAVTFKDRYGVDVFAVDPSAARMREAMEARGLYVVKAKNAILDGIRCVQRTMTIDGDGTPNFIVDPICQNLIRELGSYAWQTGKVAEPTDKPIDAFNHSLDALRYAACELDESTSPPIDFHITGKDEDDEGRVTWNSIQNERVWR